MFFARSEVRYALLAEVPAQRRNGDKNGSATDQIFKNDGG
jgi:hypothetical protein